MKVKYYNLKKGDIANHSGDLHTFIKVDGMYAKWIDKKGEMVTGNYGEYKKKDGIYYPVTN